MSETIVSARRRRGTLRGRLTRIERDIAALEAKETMSPEDRRKAKRLDEQLREIDRDFEQRHCEVLDFIKEDDKTTLDIEETMFDEHVNRVADFIDRLEILKGGKESAVAPTVSAEPSRGLAKRLRFMDKEKEAIVESVRSIPTGPDANALVWLQGCQKERKSMHWEYN